MPLIVAHRGAPRRALENTIASFEAALAIGADMIEFDVRQTGDGVPVVFHDPWVSRRSPNALIKNLTYAELIKLTLRRGFVVPTLEETLKTLKGRVMLDIELKEPGYEEKVIVLAQSYFDADRFMLTSFDPAIAATVRAAAPRLTTGFLLASAEAFPYCPTAAADFLAPQYRLFRTQRVFFADAKRSGARIAVWTVDGALQLSRLFADPIVDAIITNRPDRALDLRKKLSEGRPIRSA
jgi:glycerophosphoryl diester phosphodiesterase